MDEVVKFFGGEDAVLNFDLKVELYVLLFFAVICVIGGVITYYCEGKDSAYTQHKEANRQLRNANNNAGETEIETDTTTPVPSKSSADKKND